MKPRFIPHVCKSEPNCEKCRDYVNKLEKYRQSISGVKSKKKSIFRLVQTSELSKDSEGKRKFELPKPRLARPLNIMS